MTDLKTHTVDSAPDAAKPFLQNAETAFSFIPNLLGNMANAPALLEAYVTLAGIFGKTSFTETERQVVMMTNNILNGCTYCMAAHTTISQGAGVADDVIESLRTDTPIADAKLEALRTFAKIINVSRGNPTDDQVKTFLAAGYTEQNILEVIVGTSLKVLSNYTNHIVGTKVDAAFAPNTWSADLVKAA